MPNEGNENLQDHLFSVKLDFEKAKEYRKNYGAYLRHNQWNDIDIEVCMLI